jgi:hypothetical protein
MAARSSGNALRTLNERERRILKGRLRDEAMTLADLGNIYGVSRERVRQIEVGAFAKLQKAMLTATANRPKQLPPVRHLRIHGGAPASISASSWGSLRAHFTVRSALPETAFGIRNLALDDRVEDCAEGRQLGKGRAAFRRGGEGHQRL